MIALRFPQQMSSIPSFSLRFAILASLSMLSVSMTGSEAIAQTGVPGVAPTPGAEGVQSYDARQLELIRVREAAQRARASAQQAAMARSAERAMEQEHLQNNVDRSIELKQLKAQAAQDAKNQTSANAYQGVSSNEIQTWRSADGQNVSIQKEVPRTFTETIPVDDDGDEKSGGIGGAMRGVFSWRPFGGKKKEDIHAIPELPEFAPAESLNLNTPPPPLQAPPAKEEKKVKVDSEKKGGLRIPLIGGLFSRDKDDDRIATPVPAPAAYQAPPAPIAASYQAPEPLAAPYYPAPSPSVAETTSPATEGEAKKGFLQRFNPFSGNGKDSVESEADGYADIAASPELPNSSYFSDNSASAGLFGPAGPSDPANGVSVSFNEDIEDDKPGFLGRMFKRGDKSDDATPATAAPSREADSAPGVYVVDGKNAQLIKFGNSTVSSDAMAMPVGTVVRMTKAGEEWSSVQLTSGTEGIIRNKTLRPATSNEGTLAMFAHLSKPQYPTTARIGRARSATGASNQSQAPVYVPTPDLPSAESGGADYPIGSSLLPPLPTSAVE